MHTVRDVAPLADTRCVVVAVVQYSWPEFVAADLSQTSLMEALSTTTWNSTKRTMFIIEGLVSGTAGQLCRLLQVSVRSFQPMLFMTEVLTWRGTVGCTDVLQRVVGSYRTGPAVMLQSTSSAGHSHALY